MSVFQKRQPYISSFYSPAFSRCMKRIIVFYFVEKNNKMVQTKSSIKIYYPVKISLIFFWLFIIVPEKCLNSQASNSVSTISSSNKNLTADTLQNAVILGDLNMVKILLKDGVNPNHVDKSGWTPLDYAKKRNRSDIENVLIASGARTFPKTIPDMVEGPHIRLIDSVTFEVSFLKNDGRNNKSTLLTNTYHVSDLPMTINNILIEPEDIDFNKKTGIIKSSFPNTSKIFVVGDIHGEYSRLLSLLKNNRIIDKNGKWNWGKGHLVFVGDIFDRGTKVTETLWLIFSLEKQAAKSGGKVHLLLGNHEPMIFNNDLRYITDEYYSLCENLGLSYSGLFDKRSVLGNWLRQKPIMVQINNFVFLHAGISSELVAMELKIDSVNKMVRDYFNNTEDKKNISARQFILSNKGVLWYRGLVVDTSRKDVVEENVLNKALAFYNARSFIIGHTEVDSISSFFDKKVIDVNIPRRNDEITEQGLLIRKDNIWVSYSVNRKKKI